MKTSLKTSFPKEKIRVLLLEGVHPVAQRELAGEGFKVTMLDKALEGAALRRALGEDGGAHVLGIRSKTQVTGEVLAACPRLLAVGAFCIGTNQVETLDAARRGVAVFNSPFSNTRSVAELTISEIIALHRRLTDMSAKVHRGEWDKSAAGAHEVRGRTLGIVGYGHIGTQVSILAEALGMRVMFYDIVSKLALGNARACRGLGELLKHADVLTLHVPATPQTEGMIGAAQLSAMKRGSMVINNARGSVVDLPALAAAIKIGHIAGAALDVFPEEPAGRGDRFSCQVQGLPNVILTPHIGGSTEEAQESIALDVIAKLTRFVNNGSTTGSVNMPIVDLPEQEGGAGQTAGDPSDRATGTGETNGPRRRHRILHFHRNVPGVLGKINDVIAARRVNVCAQYLQTRGEVGYVVIDIEPQHGKDIVAELRAMPEAIRVRVLW